MTLGTSSPVRLLKAAAAVQVRPSESYFFVKIHAAQAAYQGSFWHSVGHIIVTSKVILNHSTLGGGPVLAIQCTRPIKTGYPESLGIATNLISLTPATMDHVNITIDFLADGQNRIQALAAIINDDSFKSVLSLAPGAVAVAKSVSGLASKILTAFLDSDSRRPVLTFTGDFNINSTASLEEAYYVILGSRDPENPLPSHVPQLSVRGTQLLADGQVVTNWSYVILDVGVVPARTKDLGHGQPWHLKLSAASAEATAIAGNPFADKTARETAWKKCLDLVREAHVLLAADPLYLPSEALAIIRAEYAELHKKIFTSGQVLGAPPMMGIDEARLLAVSSADDLATHVQSYHGRVREARAKLDALGAA